MDGGWPVKIALFGWDHQTWMRAFAWAKVNPVRVNDAEQLTPEQWDTLIGVHSKWMRDVGIPEGPSGKIILQ